MILPNESYQNFYRKWICALISCEMVKKKSNNSTGDFLSLPIRKKNLFSCKNKQIYFENYFLQYFYWEQIIKTVNREILEWFIRYSKIPMNWRLWRKLQDCLIVIMQNWTTNYCTVFWITIWAWVSRIQKYKSFVTTLERCKTSFIHL